MAKQASGHRREGAVYLSSLGTTPYYEAPTIDAEKLFHLQKNVYAAGAAMKQRTLIFQDKYTITATNPDGEQDDSTTVLAEAVTKMTDRPAVDMWSKMQKSMYDFFYWGAALYNPVWDYEGNEYLMQGLYRLPPHSFRNAAPGATYRYADILPGISFNPTTNKVEFWQTDDTGLQTQLENVVMIKDPVSDGLAGEPIIVPLVPILEMLNFAWQAQMQKVNREGAPIILLKLTNPTDEDIRYGNYFLKNWGKNSAWELRDNMEVVPMNFSTNDTALETITALSRMLIDHFSPASYIGKDGTLIGGSAMPELELMMVYVRGYHQWIAPAFERLLDPYLIYNGYAGYSIHIELPNPKIDRSEIRLKQAEFGLKAGTMSPDELRDYGSDLDPLSEEGWEKLKEEIDGLSKQSPVAPEIMDLERAKVISGDRLDPFKIVDQAEFQQTMRSLLRLKPKKGTEE